MTYLAVAECRQSGWAFAETFRNQYVITSAKEAAPRGWKTRKIGDWRISHCAELPLTDLVLSDGSLAGLVLGYAISPEGLMLEGKHKMPVKARAPRRVSDAEAFVAQLAGRFVAILCFAGAQRIYPDPSCGLGPVYHPQSRRAGASTTLVLDRDIIDNPEVPAEAVAAREDLYLFGHTADAEVRRATPNHYLDLKDFTEHRHWPTEDTALDAEGLDHREAAQQIADKLALNVGALAGRHPTAMPVTGGTDSRILLAASQEHLGQIGQFFVYRTNWNNKYDADIAQEIAEVMCLPLKVISSQSAQVQQAYPGDEMDTHLAQSHLRGGFELGQPDPRTIRAMKTVPRDALILRGNVAEMTRALRWHRKVFDDPHNTEYALSRLAIKRDGSTRYDEWADRLHAWKATLPEAALPRLYDFLHAELWLPHGNGAAYIADPRHFYINPFNDRHLIHLTTRVPPRARKRMKIVNNIIAPRARPLLGIDFLIDRIREVKRRNAA